MLDRLVKKDVELGWIRVLQAVQRISVVLIFLRG
jgi:hypothetical protein